MVSSILGAESGDTYSTRLTHFKLILYSNMNDTIPSGWFSIVALWKINKSLYTDLITSLSCPSANSERKTAISTKQLAESSI